MPLSAVEGVDVRPELGVGDAADAPYLDGVVGLVWRALVVWVFLLVLASLAGAL
jgi:hypothetical protein